jgi:hypothetical protein
MVAPLPYGRAGAVKWNREAGMATKQIWEEAFKAGFKAGYANGRVAELNRTDIETNAEASYQHWWNEKRKSEPPLIDSGTC